MTEKRKSHRISLSRQIDVLEFLKTVTSTVHESEDINDRVIAYADGWHDERVAGVMECTKKNVEHVRRSLLGQIRAAPAGDAAVVKRLDDLEQEVAVLNRSMAAFFDSLTDLRGTVRKLTSPPLFDEGDK